MPKALRARKTEIQNRIAPYPSSGEFPKEPTLNGGSHGNKKPQVDAGSPPNGEPQLEGTDLPVYEDPDSGYFSSNDNSNGGYFDEEFSATHPRSYDHDHGHVEKLEVFAKDLDHALKASFPVATDPYPYTGVHVLLIRWLDDDLNIQREITRLHNVLAQQFGFQVEQWLIPSENSTRALQAKLYDFQDAHQSEKELIMVYYGGHGQADVRRGRSIWKANRQPGSPSLNWSSLQTLLETAVPHVLIILDCCFAANAARDTTQGTTKEILAACGRESPTLGVCERSFTSALVEELQSFEAKPFTVAMLHSRLVTMRWRLAFTPVYALLSEHGGNSIAIAPFPDLTLPPVPELSTDSASTCNMVPATHSSPKPATRVLLSISVAQEADFDLTAWTTWLTTAAPWDVTKVDVNLHSVFKSHSTMALISIPIAGWNLLPERPAYRFVGFIKSGNLLECNTLRAGATRITDDQPDSIKTEDSKTQDTTSPDQYCPKTIKSDNRETQDPKRAKHSWHDLKGSNREEHSRALSLEEKWPRTIASDDKRIRHLQDAFNIHKPINNQKAEETKDNTSVNSQNFDTWSHEKDILLLDAHSRGMDWSLIASRYFPQYSANACRKRHERLIEKHVAATNRKEEERLGKAYLNAREQMWKMLADQVGEKWQTVEAKCMGRGLKSFPSLGHTESKRKSVELEEGSNYFDPEIQLHDFNDRGLGLKSGSIPQSSDKIDDYYDSGIGTDSGPTPSASSVSRYTPLDWNLTYTAGDGGSSLGILGNTTAYTDRFQITKFT